MINRRDFIKLTACAGLALPALTWAQAPKRVVVLGAGYAGASVAKYLSLWGQAQACAIEVVVVEQYAQFVSCPLSNLVLGGSKNINQLTFGYDALKASYAIRWVHDTVTAIDVAAAKVHMQRGELSYDKLVIAPGVDFIHLPALQTAEAQQKIPHAWKAGWQTVNLRQQLEAMPNGGVFIISIPKAPYRCPPGPYERVCQVAAYFKQYKPQSKIIVLDANPDIVSKKALFSHAWAELYAGMIEYRPNSSVQDVDVVNRTVVTEFEQLHGDVINVIPAQRAGKLAQMAGLAQVDKRWCEVDFLSYASMLAPNVHIIGDAVSAALPKSAHMATSQAKVCANAIVAMLNEQEIDPAPVFANTCYSYVNAEMAMHVANVYRYDAQKKVMLPAEGGGVSDKPSELEASYAAAWAQNIWSDVLT
jgi:sulfide dehydrogenase [flavocytochrome c] flavoprotein chain